MANSLKMSLKQLQLKNFNLVYDKFITWSESVETNDKEVDNKDDRSDKQSFSVSDKSNRISRFFFHFKFFNILGLFSFSFL